MEILCNKARSDVLTGLRVYVSQRCLSTICRNVRLSKHLQTYGPVCVSKTPSAVCLFSAEMSVYLSLPFSTHQSLVDLQLVLARISAHGEASRLC